MADSMGGSDDWHVADNYKRHVVTTPSASAHAYQQPASALHTAVGRHPRSINARITSSTICSAGTHRLVRRQISRPSIMG